MTYSTDNIHASSPRSRKMLPYLLVLAGGGVTAFGMSYFPALQARKGYPFAVVGIVIAGVGLAIADSELILLFSMFVLIFLAPALSFPIHDIRTRKNKKH